MILIPETIVKDRRKESKQHREKDGQYDKNGGCYQVEAPGANKIISRDVYHGYEKRYDESGIHLCQ